MSRDDDNPSSPIQVRLAISHALAQSTKLSVYEERVVALVEESRHLPQVCYYG